MTTHKECTVTSNHTHHTTIPARQRRITAPGSLRMVARTTPFAAAIAVSALGSLSLGAGIAQADPIQVKPGLTCDDFAGYIRCDNTTNADYTVIQTRHCMGGDWSDINNGFGYDPVTGKYDNGPRTEFHTADPSVQTATIFVAANNTGFGTNGCDNDEGATFVYTIQLP
jgi:hypothetical protein